MEAKPFAVGVRAEHSQQMINDSQYGENCPYELPAAAYKVAEKLRTVRAYIPSVCAPAAMW